ncbi:hypothetical protein RFI_15005 [Reticulomyxa filosa]|uniref:GOLD domain-containing protein n=1 Tax=Reticulomyxa filosa TaxID=46433 RepID=X6N7D0_RETFI|nr:hypothetical protein RFI_15005 [Reticulomyxa filosa]|eukprot:ETO22195.1 hypothetical protein RFI_15005 [Reticulomyxa filosa]
MIFGSIFLTTVHGIGFYLKPGEIKCLSEHLDNKELLVGEFSITPPSTGASNAGGVKVTVSDPLEVNVYDKVVDNGKFAFTSPAEGEYVICFKSQDTVDKTVNFDVHSGVKAKDYSALAKKEHLKPIETDLKRIQDMAKETLNRYKAIREIEDKIYSDTSFVYTTFLLLLLLFFLPLSHPFFFFFDWCKEYLHTKKFSMT